MNLFLMMLESYEFGGNTQTQEQMHFQVRLDSEV